MKAVLGALTSVILMLDLVTGLPASNITPDLAKRLAEADAAADAAVPGAPGVGMKWTGEVFPGKEYELWGDAQSILTQIYEINPEYVANHTLADTQIASRGLDKRAKNHGPCGNFATADPINSYSNTQHVLTVGGACHVAGRSCIRMACLETSGMYLCNDNAGAIDPQCKYISSYGSNIIQHCAESEEYVGFSGQEFDTDHYNVIMAYANCGFSASYKPSGYAKPGPNGGPHKTCSNCVSAP